MGRGFRSALAPQAPVKRGISLNWGARALADFQSRAGLRAHPAKLARSQFSEWSSIEIENQNLTFIHEHFRPGSIGRNHERGAFDDRRKMRRLHFEAPLGGAFHVVPQPSSVLTDPDAVAFGLGQGETAGAGRRQPVTGARQFEATAINGHHLATRRDGRSRTRPVPEGLLRGSERNRPGLPSDRPSDIRNGRARRSRRGRLAAVGPQQQKEQQGCQTGALSADRP